MQAIQLSKNCNVDVLVIIQNKSLKKVTQYWSGKDEEMFTLDKASMAVESTKSSSND